MFMQAVLLMLLFFVQTWESPVLEVKVGDAVAPHLSFKISALETTDVCPSFISSLW